PSWYSPVSSTSPLARTWRRKLAGSSFLEDDLLDVAQFRDGEGVLEETVRDEGFFGPSSQPVDARVDDLRVVEGRGREVVGAEPGDVLLFLTALLLEVAVPELCPVGDGHGALRLGGAFHRSEGVELFQVVRLRLGGGDEVLQGGFSEGFIPFGGPTGQRPGALEGWPDAAHEWHPQR